MRPLFIVFASFTAGLLVALSLIASSGSVDAVSARSLLSFRVAHHKRQMPEPVAAEEDGHDDHASPEEHHHRHHSSSSSSSSSSSDSHVHHHVDADATTVDMTTTTISRSSYLSDDDDDDKFERDCSFISHHELEATLRFVICGGGAKKACPRDFPAPIILESENEDAEGFPENGGFGLNMWAVVVNRAGRVCAVAQSGPRFDSTWSHARVMAAQKASTANGFSTDKFALSSGNLYTMSLSGGAMFGVQDAVPVDAASAYTGSVEQWGESCQGDHDDEDPLCGKRIGGVSTTGGGLALFNKHGKKVGALGVAGDCPCTDHIVAWKVRFLLEYDYVSAGVGRSYRFRGDQDGVDLVQSDNLVINEPGGDRKRQFSPLEKLSDIPEDFLHPFCDVVSFEAIMVPSGLPKIRNIIRANDDDDDDENEQM